MQQYDIIKLLEDINPKIKKGMIGVILEVYKGGEAFEVEFVKNDGTNYGYNGNFTFTIHKDKVEIVN